MAVTYCTCRMQLTSWTHLPSAQTAHRLYVNCISLLPYDHRLEHAALTSRQRATWPTTGAGVVCVVDGVPLPLLSHQKHGGQGCRLLLQLLLTRQGQVSAHMSCHCLLPTRSGLWISAPRAHRQKDDLQQHKKRGRYHDDALQLKLHCC
jgi:hypothetical protein